RSYSFLFLMQVIRASNSCHGKLWLLKAGNPRRTFPLRSVFSTFPTDRKFEFKLEIKGGGATFCRAAISKCSLTMSNKCFTGSGTEWYILCKVHEWIDFFLTP
ncbi:hypothetical protein EMCRGX_G010837, partial [Ephydatia muelleri]